MRVVSEVVLGILGSCAILAILYVGGSKMADYNSRKVCEQISETTGMPTRFRVPSGCYIQYDGKRWMQVSRFNNLQDFNNGKR